MTNTKLSPEDQARVDGYISRGYNDVERRPFRPFLLLFFLFIVVMGLGGAAWAIAKINGYL